MKKIIFTGLLIFLFVGCLTSSLDMDENGALSLNYDSQSYLLSSEVLEKTSLNFKDLYVDRYKIRNNRGDVLFYEDARTALDFEFNFGEVYTILYIFDNAQQYEEVYERNNLKMLQLKLKDGEYVNIIIQASDTQEYSYVYGFSNKEFIEIYNAIKTDDAKSITLKHVGLSFNRSSKNVTNWHDKLVYFTPLITPLRVMSKF